MKIFITGIAGFLDSHIADSFINLGHEVGGVDNLLSGYRDNVPEGAYFLKGDLLDLEFATDIMRNYDIVYHTACTVYEGLSVFSPDLVCANTVQIAVSTMVAAINNNVKRLVHRSSMARYGAQDLTLFTEEMNYKPQAPYDIKNILRKHF